MKKVFFMVAFFSCALFSEDRFFTLESVSSEKVEEIVEKLDKINRNQEAIIYLLGQMTRIALYYEPEIRGENTVERENKKTEDLFKTVKKIQAADGNLPIASLTQ